MSEELPIEIRKFRWREHKFLLLVGATIIISFILVGVALGMYARSGAAQLDLSRPGYKDVREHADRNDQPTAFPATGKITNDSLSDFRDLYDTQSKRVTEYESFGGDPLSDKALGLDTPVAEPQP